MMRGKEDRVIGKFSYNGVGYVRVENPAEELRAMRCVRCGKRAWKYEDSHIYEAKAQGKYLCCDCGDFCAAMIRAKRGLGLG